MAVVPAVVAAEVSVADIAAARADAEADSVADAVKEDAAEGEAGAVATEEAVVAEAADNVGVEGTDLEHFVCVFEEKKKKLKRWLVSGIFQSQM